MLQIQQIISGLYETRTASALFRPLYLLNKVFGNILLVYKGYVLPMYTISITFKNWIPGFFFPISLF